MVSESTSSFSVTLSKVRPLRLKPLCLGALNGRSYGFGEKSRGFSFVLQKWDWYKASNFLERVGSISGREARDWNNDCSTFYVC